MIEIWQSDLRVTMEQNRTDSRHHYSINVKTENDDMSRSPHLIITLPRNSRVTKVNFSDGYERTAYQVYGNASQADGTDNRVDGYVKVDFRNLNSENVDINISIMEVGEGWKKGDGASAFVFSLTPEYNKENNYKYLAL